MLKLHAHDHTAGRRWSWALQLGLRDIQDHILESSIHFLLSLRLCVKDLPQNEGEYMISR